MPSGPLAPKLMPTLTWLVPRVFSLLLFGAAAMLLFSSVTPSEPQRLLWAYKFIPLTIMEASHLLASISGIGLLFLSFTIRQRMDSAYYLTLAILGISAFASLLKGWEIEEASLLLALFVLFLPTKSYFYRRSQILAVSLSFRALALGGSILAAAALIGFYSYKHIAYSNELWLKFSVHDDPSRFLRTLGTLLLFLAFFWLYRFLTRPYNGLTLPTDTDIIEAQTIIQKSPESASFLVLMRDKYLLWSTTRQSFIMFGIRSRYWIAMGDPIGNPAEFPELIDSFREAADRHGSRIAFYEVGPQHVSSYLDAGMSLMKIGEQARVNLTTFSLEGKNAQKLRQSWNRFVKEEILFEVIEGPAILPILPQLKTISDDWIRKKNVREKSFSLGRFDPDYLCYCRIAILRHGPNILAFANLFTPDTKEELSLDLMRYGHEAPSGIMENLTTHAILWGQAQGYKWFNLGMAPLAGFSRTPLSPTWHKMGHLVFSFGGEFYNFKGLYQYKNKFVPEWKSRYLACPSNLQGTAVLLATAGLISRGLKGIFKA